MERSTSCFPIPYISVRSSQGRRVIPGSTSQLWTVRYGRRRSFVTAAPGVGARPATKSAASPLMGRLFDERGGGLTPSHAVKGERRYRYYVSRNLIKGTADSAGRGWRLPAPEIERTVAASASQILSDRTAIVAAAQAIGLADNRLPSLFSVAAAWMKRLQSEVEAGSALNALVDRVEIKQNGIQASIKLPIPSDEGRDAATPNELALARFVPMRMKRRGVEMRLIIDGDAGPAARVDPPLLKAIARAYRWSDDLVSGRVRSIGEIAKRERLTGRYVRCVMRLAFLAPKIVEAIAEGRQPADLTTVAMTHRIDLPPLWSAQERALDIR